MDHHQFLSDAKIAQNAVMRPIAEIAELIGLKSEDLIHYGEYKAKIKMSSLNIIC